MSKGNLVENEFPAMKWQGMSELHRSVFRDLDINEDGMAYLSKLTPEQVMAALVQANYHKVCLDFIKALPLGDEVEWLVDQEQLAKLVYYLTYRSLTGNKPTLSGMRIINPWTGNVFIPIGLRNLIVFGIRFWAGGSEGDGHFRLGFRIRFTPWADEEFERKKTREALQEMETTTNEVKALQEVNAYMEVPDPSNVEEVAPVRLKIAE